MQTAGAKGARASQTGKDLSRFKHPGVYLQDEFGLPRRTDFLTGVPVFVGVLPAKSAKERGEAARKLVYNKPLPLSLWSQFERDLGRAANQDYLAYAVRGFFENGGQRCFVVPLESNSFNDLLEGLKAVEILDTIDLVCAPDLMKDAGSAFELQQFVVNHCETSGDRFAILDSRRGDDKNAVWEQWSEIEGKNGAIYYPWIKVRAFDGGIEEVPPCGHIAGVFARTDRSRGVHKAPANELLNGVVDLERPVSDADQDFLNPKRINCLRAFPGRGIRVWGARTLSGDTAWTYVNVRRVLLTAVRWIGWNMTDIVFEPNNPALWPRVQRELNTYFSEQFRAGALKGNTPQESFYVKCDAETNTPEFRESGQVVTEIGLALTVPFEFVVIRLIHGAKGVTLTGPQGPKQLS